MYTPRFLAPLQYITIPLFNLGKSAKSHPTLRADPLPQATVMKSSFPTVGGWCEACQNTTMTQCAAAKYLASINSSSPGAAMSSKGAKVTSSTFSMAGLAIVMAVCMGVLMYT